MDDVFYDELIVLLEKFFYKMISIGEEGEYELLVNLIFVIKEIYYYRIIFEVKFINIREWKCIVL